MRAVPLSLDFSSRRSRQLPGLWWGMHGLAALGPWLSASPAWLSLLVTVALLGHARWRLPTNWYAARIWRVRGTGWQWRPDPGDTGGLRSARMSSESDWQRLELTGWRRLGPLVMLHVRDEASRRRGIVFARDMLAPEDWRRLSVYLRLVSLDERA